MRIKSALKANKTMCYYSHAKTKIATCYYCYLLDIINCSKYFDDSTTGSSISMIKFFDFIFKYALDL